MKKLSQALLIIFLFCALIANAQTKDVYEYATVSLGYTASAKPVIAVSYSSGEYKEIEIEKAEAKTGQTAWLKYIAQMNKEGWEVVNSQQGGIAGSWAYFLKRKQK